MWGGCDYSHLTDEEASEGPGAALAPWQWEDEGLQTEHPVSVPPAPLPALLRVLPRLPSRDLDPHHGPLVRGGSVFQTYPSPEAVLRQDRGARGGGVVDWELLGQEERLLAGDESPPTGHRAGTPAPACLRFPRGRESNGLLKESWSVNHNSKL